MRFSLLVQLLEAGQKAGLESDFGRAVVIRMTRLPVRQDHHARFERAYLNRKAHPYADRVLKARIGKAHVAAPRELHAAASGIRFLQPCLGSTASPHVARGEIEHTGAITCFRHSDEAASAGLL